jgi:hypothetical protein
MIGLKDNRAQSRLEKVARETANAGLHYEVEARAVREKNARLRALRIAKEAEEKSTALGKDVAGRKSVTKRSAKSTGELARPASPLDQTKSGLRD